MNRTTTLIVAAVLGLAGAVLNFIYLNEKSRDVEKVDFIGIAPGTTIAPGEKFTEDRLTSVPVPQSSVGDLSRFAVLYSDRKAILDLPAARRYTGGELLLQQDLKTPPPVLALKNENERAIWIPVDTRTFVPSLVNPGDMVSFLVASGPTPAAPSDTEEASATEPVSPPSGSELIGPFRVLSLGNRLGSVEVLKAAGQSQQQENVMTVSVNIERGNLEPKAAKLWKLLQATNFRQVSVLLHPHGSKTP